MLKLLKRNPTELETLQQESRELTHKIATLSAKARATDYLGDKKEFLTQKATLSKKKNSIETRINRIREKLSLPRTEAMCKQNLNRIYLTVNGYTIKIEPETLKVKFAFSCGHAKTMSLYEILRHQSTLKSNRALYSKWQALFTNSGVISGAFLCEECMKQKKKEMADRHIYRPTKRTGQANWTLEVR